MTYVLPVHLERPPMLRAAAGWIWITLLAAAPWAYACLDDWAKIGLGAAGVLATLLWLAHHIRMALVAGGTRRSLWWNGRWACIAAVAAILLLGWWMAGNAHSVYVAAQRHLTPVASILPASPGAADRFTAAETMWPLTGILGLLLVAADLGREPRWRERFAGCVSLTAASIAAYGILEKLHLLPHLTVQPGFPTSAFGPFDYHGNAAAFLNLAIPAGFYLAFSRSAQLSPKSYILRIIGSASLLLCVVGEGFNISRAGVMIGGVEVAVLVGWAVAAYRPRALGRRFAWLGAAVLAIVLAAGVGVTLFLHPGHRGSLVEDYLQRPLWHSGRFLAWRVAWGMSADAPWFGSGAGSFKLLFPLSPHWIPELYSRWIITWHTPGTRVSGWSYACEDYLQTL
ncbi:MAG TPA: hypothetical protein VHQ47_09260, partial [Phycisphaerae bacterium]|nr:hypothetical protein [Phycisphaerae bacterium]